MLSRPKTCPPTTTLGQARTLLRNDHVHTLLIVENELLLTVVERSDLQSGPADAPARTAGRLLGRVVSPEVDLDSTWQRMRSGQHRRLAVVDSTGRLLGLLCLKQSGSGFCTDAGVLSRALGRRGQTARDA